MTSLPNWFTGVLNKFVPLFSTRVWSQIQLLLIGVLLSPGKRAVTAALWILGLAIDARFSTFHRLLSRAGWSSLQASRVLLGLLLAAFVPAGPLVLGLDDTYERRKGGKIHAKGIYRDPVRPNQSQRSALAERDSADPIPWAHRI
jgi:DDE superfamily endonuclease